MALQIYNTLSGTKEAFVPLRDRDVGMYVCGVTVYDLCHVGHARSAVVFDAIFRYLRHRGYRVTYVRNFTDVDDKIIRRAREEHVPWREIAERYIQAFYEDMDALGLERPSYEPRATDHIDEMIEMISRLIDRGHAYVVDGDVYFAVESFPGYGRLSGRSLEEMRAGARVEVDEKKGNPLDFALWKSSKPGEPTWKSPWGEGRPGWHIECSAMSQKYLGDSFDIHGGGKDLVFPHHENEIAQSEGSTGRPFARYWIHNGFVNIRQEKMSKSLGNVLNIRDLLRLYHPEALRLFLLSHHYRSPLDFSDEAMREHSLALDRLYGCLEGIESFLKGVGFPPDKGRGNPRSEMEKGFSLEISTFFDRVAEAMDEDFNTAKALARLFDLVRLTNRFLDQRSAFPTEMAVSLLHEAREAFRFGGRIFGLFSEEPEAYAHGAKKRGLQALGIDEREILDRIQERNEARRIKDWQKADAIRKGLSDRGILLEDGPEGTRWRLR